MALFPRALFPRAKVRGLRSGLAVKRSYPMPEVRGSSREELPHVQGKEQQLCFAGIAVKRYPMPKVSIP